MPIGPVDYFEEIELFVQRCKVHTCSSCKLGCNIEFNIWFTLNNCYKQFLLL